MEQAPNINISKDEEIKLSVDLQMTGEMNLFQGDYLYWDKVKYKTRRPNKHEVWAAIKFHRSITSKRISFGKYTFSYPTTDFLQRSLHLFDLHAGGTLT